MSEPENPLPQVEPALAIDGAKPLGYGAGTVWDEMVTGTGKLRPQWQFLMGRLAPLDAPELDELRDEASRLVRQNGVAYTVYGDPKGAERLWPLDLVPLLIPETEWRVIEAGAIQRAQLMNAILADVYGPQKLIADKLLPPSLLHANRSFLRPCVGFKPPGGVYLHLCAIDLARSPDGRWWVLSDRAQSPSGAGYALENRSVVGRVLADSLNEGTVEPIAPFFERLRENLRALAPASARQRGRPPRVVLLTPGPYNETYFEHAYLARQLGITLVEGGDLTVRDRHVFLKTLSALEPIDVIFRRLDDDFCDPLELRADSSLGVSGLTEAARSGTVTIANALGSGLLEASAFKPFFPTLCQNLLGEALQLPDVATWWCGSASERRYVLDNLEGLVVKSAFPTHGSEPVFGAELSAAERDKLAKRIEARPIDFVGQERVELSTVPVWNGAKFEPRPLVLRVFVAAGEDGFAVMPGGLTRTSPLEGPPIVTMQRGGGCKDTWVVGGRGAGVKPAADAANVVSLRQTSSRRAAAGELPSRAADGLFWVGRYAERTNGLVRLLRTLLLGITDAARPWTIQEVEPLLTLAGSLNLLPALDLDRAPSQALGLLPLIQTALADPQHPGGAPMNLQRLARAASGVRDYLPLDCGRILAAFTREATMRPGRPAPAARLLLRLDELVMYGSALWGAVEDTMQRDPGWRFLEMGKWLERAINLIAIVRGIANVAANPSSKRIAEDQLLATLLAASGMQGIGTGKPDGTLDRGAVIAAVLNNETDPFSFAFQLHELSHHLMLLPPPGAGASVGIIANPAAISQALELLETARELLIGAIAAGSVVDAGQRSPAIASLYAALLPLDSILPEVSNLLTQAYFTHVFARPA